MNGAEHRTPIRVYIEDTDAGGIVYYVNYLKFMERARTEMLRAIGYQQRDLQQQGLLFVVQSVQSRYVKPAFLDDPLVVNSQLRRQGAASLTFVQRVLCALKGTLLCEAEIKVACVDAQSMRPKAIPKQVAASVRHFMEQAEPTA